MKTKLLILATLIFTLSLQAQIFSKSIKNDIVEKQSVIIDAVGTTQPLIKNYYIRATKEEDSDYLVVDLIADDPTEADNIQKKVSFKIYPLVLEDFSTKFKQAFSNLVKQAESKTVYSTDNFSDLEISLLFVQLIAFERTENERPVVANIALREDIPVMIKSKDITGKTNESDEIEKSKKEKIAGKKVKDAATDKGTKKTDKDLKKEGDSLVELCKIKNAKLELTFYNGFIEKIELEATIKSRKVRFTNIYSVGISSSKGIKEFVNNNIHTFYAYKLVGDTLVRDSKGSKLSVNFADVIDYDREIDINANDISPEPTKLVLTNLKNKTTLYKEESTKLFEAIVYSDFLGVFDAENPNGILQTEVAKKFFINNHRYQIIKKGKWFALLFPPVIFSEGYGWFEYLDVSARLSKIEENNKFLTVGTLNGASYFSPLRIMQHESFSIGADLNILYLENQNKKVNTNLDIGVRYGRSGLQIDELTQEFFNNITTSAELGFQFIPEKRYGFIASARVSYFQVYNDDGFELKSKEDDKLVNPKHWFNKTQFEFFVNTSTTGKLFIRYKFLTELDDWDNNFSQFQFGYSFYLLKQNGKSK